MKVDLFQNKIRFSIRDAILQASTDYYAWSRGKTIQDSPAEAIPQVYVARHIFDNLNEETDLIVEIEYRTRAIFTDVNTPEEFRSGRVDLYAGLGDSGPQALIEIKRYLNHAVIESDAIRLAELVRYFKSVGRMTSGHIAAVMYNAKNNHHVYKDNYDKNLLRLRSMYEDVKFTSYVYPDISEKISSYIYEKSRADRHVSIIIAVE